jgi:hypothetical protein
LNGTIRKAKNQIVESKCVRRRVNGNNTRLNG